MQLSTQASVDIAGASPEAVFAYATDPVATTQFFRGYGPIPAIRQLEMLDGAQPAPGARRRIELANGQTLLEEVLTFDPPTRHTYRATGYTAPFSWLTHEGIGDWTFVATPHGTHLTWHYTYQLTSPLAWPAGSLLIRFLMRGAMQRALDAIKTHFERPAASAAP